MKVLVTGANGFIGSWLVDRLQNEGHQVSILVRKTSDLTDLSRFKGTTCYGDVTNLQSLREAFKNQEAIFHLAGLVAYHPKDRPAMENVNVLGTQNVCQAVEEMNVQSMVYFSSVVAIGAGQTPDQVMNEESSFNLHGLNMGYFETKHDAENKVIALSKKNICKVAIVNPSTVYGPGDARKGSRSMQVKVAQGRVPLYTNGGANVVSIHDVVEGTLQAWKRGRQGERYILGSENLTIHQLLKQICDFAGSQPPSILLPNWMLRSVGLVGDLGIKLGLNPAMTSETFQKLTRYHWFDSTRARTELGIQFKPAAFAIEESVRWMKDNHLLNSTSGPK